MAPKSFRVTMQHGDVAGYHWPNPAKPPLLMLHANGMNARSYFQFLAAFVEHYDIRAIDLRGHGLTTLPANPQSLKNWHCYKDDVLDLLEKLELSADAQGITLMGHSLGAVVSLMVAGTGRVTVDDLIMIEPVLMPEIVSHLFNSPLGSFLGPRIPIAKEAKARRARFADRAAIKTAYQKKPFFARWGPQVLVDYLEDGVIAAQDGVRLACDPAWEAASFAAQQHNPWEAYRAIVTAGGPDPVLIYGENNSTTSAQARRRFAQIGARALSLSGASHLIPQEQPAKCSAAILSLLNKGR